MTDDEFLRYCEEMTQTPDCGMLPEQIARLLRLSGSEVNAKYWDNHPVQVIRHHHVDVVNLVHKARLCRHHAKIQIGRTMSASSDDETTTKLLNDVSTDGGVFFGTPKLVGSFPETNQERAEYFLKLSHEAFAAHNESMAAQYAQVAAGFAQAAAIERTRQPALRFNCVDGADIHHITRDIILAQYDDDTSWVMRGYAGDRHKGGRYAYVNTAVLDDADGRVIRVIKLIRDDLCPLKDPS